MMADGNLIDIHDLPERLRGRLATESSMDDHFLSLDEMQRRHVRHVLEGVGGNKSASRRDLGYWACDDLSIFVQDETCRENRTRAHKARG